MKKPLVKKIKRGEELIAFFGCIKIVCMENTKKKQ